MSHFRHMIREEREDAREYAKKARQHPKNAALLKKISKDETRHAKSLKKVESKEC